MYLKIIEILMVMVVKKKITKIAEKMIVVKYMCSINNI